VNTDPPASQAWRQVFLQVVRFLATPTKIPSHHEVLYVASPCDISMPSENGLVSQYLQPFHQSIERMGFTSVTVLRPNTGPFRGVSRYRIHRFPRIRNRRLVGVLFRSFPSRYMSSRDIWREIRQKVRVNSPHWSDLLEQVRPKLVIGIGLTDEICEAARQASIPTIEVQHGFFEETLPYWKKTLPDYFFCWDDLSAEKAKAAGLRAVVSGHPFEHLVGSNSKISKTSRGTVCCVCLSWGDTNSVDKFGSLSPAVFDWAKEIQASGVELVLRLHPVMSRMSLLESKRYAAELRRLIPGSKIQNPANVSLPQAISACDFALTESSSTAFDFALLGKTTLVAHDKARAALSVALSRYGLPGDAIQACSQKGIAVARSTAGWDTTKKVTRPLSVLLEKVIGYSIS
jgi:hypothetical protein